MAPESFYHSCILINNQQPLFNIDKFKRSLATRWLAQNLLYFEELESTNTYLRRLSAEQIDHGLLCIADHQTKGRGRYERNWESSPGKNLTFTLVFKPIEDNRFHVLSLACARAAVDQIEDATGCEAQIKWPNDIMIDGKKAGGFLTETVFSGNRLDRVLVGIGLNVNQDHFPKELEGKAISLRQLTNKKLDREQFLCDFLSRIEYEYGRWHKHNGTQIKTINQKIVGYGRWIKLCINGDELDRRYKLLGVNEKGQLALIDDEGGIETFSYEQIRLITD